MYTGILHLHNTLRWLLVITIVVVLVKYLMGWFGHKKWSKSDNILGIIFSSLIDLQLLAGLILYFFLSPITKTAFQNIGEAMKNTGMRFYLVEHFLMMLIVVVLVHIGRLRSKKAQTDRGKFGRALAFYGIACAVMLAAIPWSRII